MLRFGRGGEFPKRVFCRLLFEPRFQKCRELGALVALTDSPLELLGNLPRRDEVL
jgi:hypothetical protein